MRGHRRRRHPRRVPDRTHQRGAPAGCSVASTSRSRCSSRSPGFLLWRGHAAAARGLRSRPPTGHYLRSRVVRIMPGYLVAVVVILTLLPDANADLTVWLANLTLTQIYVPLTLTAGPDPDVEPVGRGQLLPGAAAPGAAGPPGAGAGPHPGDRRRRRWPAWAGACCPSTRRSGSTPLNWPPAFFVLVRRGHAAGRVDASARSAGRTGWRGGAVLMAVVARGRLPGGGLPAGRARRG